MHETIPTTEPTHLTAGESWAWDREFPDHSPAEGWLLRYRVRGARDMDLDATANGDAFQVRVAPVETDAQPEGEYRLIGTLERENPPGTVTERHIVYDTVDLGAPLIIRASPLAAVGVQPFEERALAAIEAVIEGRASADEKSFQVGGRSVEQHTLAELLDIQERLQAKIAQRRRGAQLVGAVNARFGRGA